LSEDNANFQETGLKKTSLIRADKIATVSQLVFQKRLGILPSELRKNVIFALKKSLNL
jgi:mRNA interferase MazF